MPMQFLRAVEANPHTKAVANWYITTPEEHAVLLAEKAAGIYIWPNGKEDEKTWWGKGFSLTQNKFGTCYISFDAPGTQPTLF